MICDVQLVKRPAAVDEHPATWRERGSYARHRLSARGGMAAVERTHPHGEDDVERKVLGFQNE